MSILKEFIEDVLKDGERVVKDALGNDVPKSPLRGHDEIKEKIQKEILDFFAKLAENLWPVAQQIGISREQFDALVKAGADKIIADDDDEPETSG
jgi:hypothetical protein